jgi:hypothetical protein
MAPIRKHIIQIKVITRRIILAEIPKSTETPRTSSPKARNKIILTKIHK